jgi:TolB-like protein/Flp pilus assembly protein TadD
LKAESRLLFQDCRRTVDDSIGIAIMPAARADDLIDPASIRNQLTKILNSALFSDAHRMVRFLQFTVEETLSGNASRLKENIIGIHVFDRPPAYDPRIDPIVRVEARRLRHKLREYYERDGKADELILDLPKGRYSPVFRTRSEQVNKPEKVPQTIALETSIAVLPFTNLNSDAETEFLCEGLTEDLVGALTRMSDLRVSAWASAARVKSYEDSVDAARDLLGVSFVLRGSIRKTNERIRILAHLIDTSAKQYLWSESFDRGLQDIFAIQDEITRAIVIALRAKLVPRTGAVANAAESQNLECYQLCLKGRFHARERTFEGLQRSALCFEGAIRADPSSASAYAGLADTLTLQAEYGVADGPTSMRKAKQAVEKALALNPASAEAQASYGLLLTLHDWAWEKAEAAFRRSFQLNPSYAPARHWYSVDHLAMLGRFGEAETELEKAIDLDPLSLILMEGRAYLSCLRRNYDEAVARYSHIISKDPSFFKPYGSMGRALLHAGQTARAIEMLERCCVLGGGQAPTIFGALGQAYGLAGDRAKASDILLRLRTLADERPVPATCFALTHLGLGDREAALTWLESGVERRESSVVGIGVHPAYDDLRTEARFMSLVHRVVPPAAVLP